MQFPPLRPPPVSSHEIVVVFHRAGFAVSEARADGFVLQNKDRVVVVRRGRVHATEEIERLLADAKMDTREFLRRLKSYRRDASEAA